MVVNSSNWPCFTHVNWDVQVYWSTANIQLSHMASRNRMATAPATSRSTPSTCRLNGVSIVRSISWLYQGMETSLNNPPVLRGHRQVTGLGEGAAVHRSTALAVTGWASERRYEVTSTSSVQREPASYCTILPWTSPCPTIPTGEIGDHSGAKCLQCINSEMLNKQVLHYFVKSWREKMISLETATDFVGKISYSWNPIYLIELVDGHKSQKT